MKLNYKSLIYLGVFIIISASGGYIIHKKITEMEQDKTPSITLLSTSAEFNVSSSLSASSSSSMSTSVSEFNVSLSFPPIPISVQNLNTKLNVVTLGDSLTTGYKIPPYYLKLYNILPNHLNSVSTISNIGWSSQDLYNNMLFSNVISTNTNVVVLLIGTNDIGRGLQSYYTLIVDLIFLKSPNTKLLLVTIPPVLYMYTEIYLTAYNNNIRNQTKKNSNIFIVDLYEKLTKTPNNYENYLIDRIHLSDQGNELFANLVVSKIKTIYNLN